MSKRDVGSLIRTLIHQKEGAGNETDFSPESPAEQQTTLGVPLEHREDRHFVIDLSAVRVFRNLHTFVRLLVSDVFEQCGFGAADIMVRRRVDPHLTPDFTAAGIDWVIVYARLDAAENLPFYHLHFANCMQVVFRSFQTGKWGGELFPEYFGREPEDGSDAVPALLFPFHLRERQDENGHYFLVEHSRPGRFLRLTIENADASRLQLKHIPHRVVDLPVRSSYLPDIHLIAEQLQQGILRECMNNRSEYGEIPGNRRDLFDHLQDGGLSGLDSLRFAWPTDHIEAMLREKRETADGVNTLISLLVKELQLLEDPLVLSCLARGNTVEMISGPARVYFDLSRYGTCLNVSFDERRRTVPLEDYLARMPVLASAAEQRRGVLVGFRLFLIHHTTAEVMGLLKAFEGAGCAALTTFFVKYGGIVPESYLETLMSQPSSLFRFYALQKLESRRSLAGRYGVSRQFGPLVDLEGLDGDLVEGKRGFLETMRLAAGHVFLAEIQSAHSTGGQVLLVEDGGYLAPLVNRFCLEGRTVREVFSHFRREAPVKDGEMPFAAWLDGVFPGSIEHTRNGYDYNLEVLNAFGRLQFPVASIAVSSLKRGPEARECAASILNAVETILHRLGMLLSRRTPLVLGSRGAIGGYLMETLGHRIDSGRLYGVDIAVADSGQEDGKPREAATLEALGPNTLRDIDLFIGVVGGSVLREGHIKDILTGSLQKELFFASGSTKTVEFSDLEKCLQGLQDTDDPRIGGAPVRIGKEVLRDLQTGALQGYRVTLSFPDAPGKNKTLYLLGELMPINFLYYGIPREVVDRVMAQLFTLSCGLVKRQGSAKRLKPTLLAVDREIDADANPIV